ncbi:Rec8 like protein-domain-containing protein [Crepidotus variabilis]|uniref:Rec8 like protein-domain-containing protein n=1 Tax=Crepidotus variabilis TaxID=179855 RepID=A0A9P6ECJ7_9AGAR|nr:Rec8 like protein-domain-containing protein [Crepidotus variabilis]
MFFTPELLARRDSGFGLLWLAATLGSKSAFKKLPKRSVLTADISQLCDMISEPAEPLALRLSSNLMFGVVRVYKVKQEIFMTDVTNCVTTLKKVVQDLHATGASDAQLQMANPVARPTAVTITVDPRTTHTLDYDAFVTDWDEFLNMDGNTTLNSEPTFEEPDSDFDPTQKQKKTAKRAAPSLPEQVRKEAHTLEEHHEDILAASYDLSFNASGGDPAGGLDPSSSQIGGGFDNFFFSDGIDAGEGLGLGDDLARELGWGFSPMKSVLSERNVERHSDLNFDDIHDINLDNMDFNFDTGDMPPTMDVGPPAPVDDNRAANPTPKRQKTSRRENQNPTPSRAGSVSSQRGPSPPISFSRQLLSQDLEPFMPLRDITAEARNKENQLEPSKKLKRTRLLLDARTELTDEELKVARAKYLQSQKHQRRELLYKRMEKDSVRIIDEMIWGAPKGLEAPELVNFWQENFKVQVEAKSGLMKIHEVDQDEDSPRPKRRKREPKVPTNNLDEPAGGGNQDFGAPHMDMDWNFDGQDVAMMTDEQPFRYSSEEPGQARHHSRSASITGANLGFDLDLVRGSGSQRSSLFPWDNAGGPSSSSGNMPFVAAGSDHPIDQVDIRLRSASLSHRDSPIPHSQRVSLGGGFTFSPVPQIGEDFAFDVENVETLEETQQDTQKTEMNLVTLERNSYNFLEYAKMQQQVLPNVGDRLSFDTVVPKATSTRHVAAAAFYHCLVLATKHLVRLEQPNPFEPTLIGII